MANFMLRVVVMAMALLCLAGQASTQSVPPASTSVPAIHAATGLKFPANINNNTFLVMGIDHAKLQGRPEFGYSWSYMARRLDGTLNIDVYTAGDIPIPDGATSPLVVSLFDRNSNQFKERFIKDLDDLKVLKGPTQCIFGGLAFRCLDLSAVAPRTKAPVYSTLALTGYRKHLVRIRLEWRGGPINPPNAADGYLDAFVGEMMR